MFLAQVAPATAPAAVSSANKFYIIGDLDAVKPDIPPSWTDLILHNLGYIALAFVIGWVAKKALGWAARSSSKAPSLRPPSPPSARRSRPSYPPTPS